MTQPFEEESIDSRNTMKETLAYDWSSALASISAEDIEKVSKEREKLQRRHSGLTQEEENEFIKRLYEIEKGKR